MKDGAPSGSPPPLNLSRRSLLAGAGGVAVAAPAILRAQGRGKQRVVVVGAGVFGAWTAHHLQRAGHQVILIDAQAPAHSRASSGGESRMTRAAYGKDAIYTRMAFDSLAQWKALDAVAGLPIFHRHGVLFFSATENDYFRDSLSVHRQLGLPLEQLGRAELQRRFPMIDFTGVEVGLFETQFGALMARRAVQTLVERFVRAGGTYRHANAQMVVPRDGPALSIALGDRERMEGDAFVFALGPWLPKLFPDILGQRIFATRQEVFYFAPPPGDNNFQRGAMPGWADFHGGDIYYGFPDLEGKGVKFAHDAHGAMVDPDTQARTYSEAALDDVIAFRDRRFPGLRRAPLIGAEVCQYENSSNGDFLIDRHPRMPNVVLVGGGSGHGFKHGPEVGRLAAALVSGEGAQPDPRFTLATKGKTQKRKVH